DADPDRRVRALDLAFRRRGHRRRDRQHPPDRRRDLRDSEPVDRPHPSPLESAPEFTEETMPDNKSGTSDIFEAILTNRAMRRLKPDPVPDELIAKVLKAGQAAASGGNTQRWKFLVLKDPTKKKAVQVYYKKLFDEVVGPRYASSPV